MPAATQGDLDTSPSHAVTPAADGRRSTQSLLRGKFLQLVHSDLLQSTLVRGAQKDLRNDLVPVTLPRVEGFTPSTRTETPFAGMNMSF